MSRARALVAGKISALALVGLAGSLPLLQLVEPPGARAVTADSVGGAPRSGGGYSFKRAERCFMRKINHKRAQWGLRKLDWDPHLGYVARRHAGAMASSGSVWHDGSLGRKITRWRALGQNVGSGGRCSRLFPAFWHSSKHRSNILGRWRFLGVGTEWHRGRLYVHHVFERRRNPGNVYRYP